MIAKYTTEDGTHGTLEGNYIAYIAYRDYGTLASAYSKEDFLLGRCGGVIHRVIEHRIQEEDQD